jgi:NhaP-type Na+/H+ or K+/H+ antiporter
LFSVFRRKIALVIILTRAGLDLDPTALKRLKVTVPKLGLIPWVVEATVVAALTNYLLDLPWIWGFLLGSIIAAVSPAVVVPCLFRLRAKGYGVAKVSRRVARLEYLSIRSLRRLVSPFLPSPPLPLFLFSLRDR